MINNLTCYVRCNLREVEGLFEVFVNGLETSAPANVHTPDGLIGFLEVFDSVAALHAAYPDAEYITIRVGDDSEPKH